MDLFKGIDIAGLAALILVAYTIIRAIITGKREGVSKDASTSKDYADSARIADERSERMAKRMSDLETGIDNLKQLMQFQSEENSKYLAILSDWARGITLLLYQIKTADMTAVWTPKKEDIQKFLNEGA